MYIKIQCDYETSETAGAGGMFQIASLNDEKGQDLTHLLEKKQYYGSLNEVKEDLAKKLNIEVNTIDLVEV